LTSRRQNFGVGKRSVPVVVIQSNFEDLVVFVDARVSESWKMESDRAVSVAGDSKLERLRRQERETHVLQLRNVGNKAKVRFVSTQGFKYCRTQLTVSSKDDLVGVRVPDRCLTK